MSCRSASQRIAAAWFLQVMVDGRALAGHDEAVKMVPSPGDGYEFWAMMK